MCGALRECREIRARRQQLPSKPSAAFANWLPQHFLNPLHHANSLQGGFWLNWWHDEWVTEFRDIESVRAALSAYIRDRVGGPGIDEKQDAYFNAPGERWFAEDAPIRQVHGDAAMFIGGVRAVLLQALHPLAMAGVDQHSDFRNDPWGRLQRTADFLAATTFGPADEAQRIIDRILHVHSFVVGQASDGRSYSANDPHLLRWVHVVEVDSFLTAHTLFGEHVLTQEQRDGYVEDMSMIAAKLGVPAPPKTEQALRDQMKSFKNELQSTAESRDAIKYLMFNPPLPYPARAAYYSLVAATVATLPAWSRDMLRIPYLPVSERFALRPLGGLFTRGLRWITAPTSPYQRNGATDLA